ncbi:MAG TPA: tyrosine-protein phosphatase [Solirubrobacterales bacterium]|jgi:protein tyrosine/serine phosphatase
MGPQQSRHLDWEGVFNARDLGGLPAPGGAEIRWGAAVRSDSLSSLTEAGWRALSAHGVRTVIDLRNDEERGEDQAPRPSSLQTVHLPLDVHEDREFWGVWESGPEFGTPLYYGPHIERFPQRNAEVIAAIAGAAPGGVAFHCVGGRDRCGQVTMLLLALLGVAPETIAADYLLSAERLRSLYRARGEADQAPELEATLRDRGTTAQQVIAGTLREVDVEATLRSGGLSSADVERLRARLLAP